LKRKLSLSRRTQANFGNVKTERDRLRDATSNSERKISQLKEIVRKAKEGEKATMEKITNLEAALYMGNVEPTDVLEGFYEARDRTKSISEQQKLLIKERDESFHRLSYVDPEWVGSIASDKESSSAQEQGEHQHQQRAARLIAQHQELASLKTSMVEKDARIAELEQLNQDTKGVEENEAFVCQLDTCQRCLRTAEAERDRYNDLLHTELRRESKCIAIKLHAATPQITDEAEAILEQKLTSGSIELEDANEISIEQRCQHLEKELKHCIQEIILYKLDVRGYKKDLKQPQMRINALQAQQTQQRPITPSSLTERASTGNDRLPSQEHRKQGSTSSGLGIYLSHPADADASPRSSTTATRRKQPNPVTITPQRGLVDADILTPHQALAKSTSPFISPAPASTPRSSTKLPPAVHKQLPATPTGIPSLSPSLAAQKSGIARAETLRSLSDSIISSYAKRGTPDLEEGSFPPQPPALPRCQSSEPKSHRMSVREQGMVEDESGHGANAVAVPVLRVNRGMVRTPVLGVGS
jgi:hypothetical protein